MTDLSSAAKNVAEQAGMPSAIHDQAFAQFQMGHDMEANWKAWCAPLLEKIRRMEHIVDGCAESRARGPLYAFNRPGISISRSDCEGPARFEIRSFNMGELVFKRDHRDGVYVRDYVVRRNEQGVAYGGFEVYAHLERSWWSQQTDILRSNSKVFADVSRLLDATEYSLLHGTPLNSTLPWNEVLRGHLEQQHPNGIDPNQWREWTRRWGDHNMLNALDVVDSLFGTSDTQVWREHLVRAWRCLHRPLEEPLNHLDTTIFVHG